MTDPAHLIEGSEKLTTVFGYWPSFHDAEVIEFNLWRGEIDTDAGKYIFPTLTTKVHLWEMTSEVDARGYYVLRHHTLATLRFHDIAEFQMDGFNHQNAIQGLSIVVEEREASTPFIRVEFEPAFGVGCAFRCTRMEVLSAEPFAPAT